MSFNFISNLNLVDFIIIGIIFFSIIVSFFRGFVREVISLIVWIVAIIVVIKFVRPVQIYLQVWITSLAVRYSVAFIGLFLSVFLVGAILNMLIHALVKKTGLNIADRLLGICFGAGRGFLIVSILLMFVMGNVKGHNLIIQSKLGLRFQPVVGWLNQFLLSKFKYFSRWLVDEQQPRK